MKIKLVILAGGKGVRISEGVDKKIPKPLSLVGDYPILLHLMFYYSSFGVNEFIICTGYKSELIKNFFKNNLSKELKKKIKEWKINIVDTGIGTNTGGRIKKIKKYLINNDFFYLTYGDALSDVNIHKLFKFHLKMKKDVTVTTVLKSERYGKVELKNNLIKKFDEKKNKLLINGGFMVISTKVFKDLKKNSDIFEKKILENYAKKKMLAGYMHKNFWQCVDNFRDWEFINNIYKKNKIKKIFMK